MGPSETPRRCHACKHGEMVPATRQRKFSPLGKEVVVELLTSTCNVCGAQSTSSQQHKENLARLRARKAQYGHLLLGEEISRFRRSYGLTQRAAARIFGKGLISFSRYESETSYPDLTMTKLLKQAMARPDVLKAMADEEGVEIPLWEARCADELARKRAIFTVLPRDEVATANWAQLQRADRRKASRWGQMSVAGALRWQETRHADLPSNDGVIEEVRAS